jgi:unsaturated rhamnogalacturonyl hydrolase
LSLLQVCEVAGLSADRDGSFEYYIKEPIRINDPKGTGPFIMASIELNK